MRDSQRTESLEISAPFRLLFKNAFRGAMLLLNSDSQAGVDLGKVEILAG